MLLYRDKFALSKILQLRFFNPMLVEVLGFGFVGAGGVVSVFISVLELLGHAGDGLVLPEAGAVLILLDEDGLLLGLEYAHEFLDLGDGGLLGLVLVGVGEGFEYLLNIVDLLVDDGVHVVLDFRVVAPALTNAYFTASHGEVLPINRRAYRLLMWYSERKSSLLRLRT